MKSIKTGGACVLMAAHAGAWAHGGHGMAASHWHATDTFGLLLVGGLAALAIWFGRGGE